MVGRDLLDGNTVPADVKGIWGTESALTARLRELSQNSRHPQTEPRLRGIAFEARLVERIAPVHVSHVHFQTPLHVQPKADASGLEMPGQQPGQSRPTPVPP